MNPFRICFCSFVAVLQIAFLSCSEPIRRVYVNPIDDGIPIVASHSIVSDYATSDTYKDLADAGFNMSYINYSSLEDALKSLKIAELYNLKLLIACPELATGNANAYLMVKDYKSFAGIRVFDEPSEKDFAKVRHIMDSFTDCDYSHLLFVNVLPNYASLKLLGTPSYEDYIDKYLDVVNPEFLSFDNYPILKGGLREGYYENLEIISRKCLKKGIPFWGYILSSAFDDYPTPTKGTMAFQAYCNLAYGAQGLCYFTYKRYSNPNIKLVMSSSPVDESYHLTDIYYIVKELNFELRYYAQFLRGCAVDGVCHVGEDDFCNKINGVDSISCGKKGIIVSEISNHGDHYLLIVNKDYKSTQTISIKPKRMLQLLECGKDKLFSFRDLQIFLIKPGEALLLLVK